MSNALRKRSRDRRRREARKEILELLRADRSAYFRNEPIQQELLDIYERREAASSLATGDESNAEMSKPDSPDNPYNIAAEKFPWLLEATSRRKAEREPVRVSQHGTKQRTDAAFPGWS